MEYIEDARGSIRTIAEGEFRTVQIIESKKGAIRANHYHKIDSHVMYILSGKARYVEFGIGADGGAAFEQIMVAGDSVTTPPLNPHGMEFLEDTVMVVASKNARNLESYTADIVPHKVI